VLNAARRRYYVVHLVVEETCEADKNQHQAKSKESPDRPFGQSQRLPGVRQAQNLINNDEGGHQEDYQEETCENYCTQSHCFLCVAKVLGIERVDAVPCYEEERDRSHEKVHGGFHRHPRSLDFLEMALNAICSTQKYIMSRADYFKSAPRGSAGDSAIGLKSFNRRTNFVTKAEHGKWAPRTCSRCNILPRWGEWAFDRISAQSGGTLVEVVSICPRRAGFCASRKSRSV
jgi:hypothetical protein